MSRNATTFVSTSDGDSQNALPQGIASTSEKNPSPRQRARNPPIFIDSLSPPRVMVSRGRKPTNAVDSVTRCDKNEHYHNYNTVAEMFIQPAMLIHPNPRVVAIYMKSACREVIRALLHQLQYFTTAATIDQVYIFRQDNHTKNDYLLGPWMDSKRTVHEGLSVITMVPPTVDTRTNLQDHGSLDLVIHLDGERSSSFGPAFWSNHLDPNNGILVMPLAGQTYHDRIQHLQKELVETTASGHFAKVTDYESHHTFPAMCLHLAMAFRSRTTYAHWHLNEAEYMVRMHQRNIPYEPLQVMDGATMTTMAFSSPKSTHAFCEWKYGNACDEKQVLAGIDPWRESIPYSQLGIQPSTLGTLAGRGVFTKVDAPQGTYLDLATSSQSIQASWTTTDLLFTFPPQQQHHQQQPTSLLAIRGQSLRHYFDGYGFYDEPFGEVASFVDSGIMTFANHGCNSTYNIGRVLSVNEWNVTLDQPPPQDFVSSLQGSVYDPLGARHALLDKVITRSLRDVRAGEELFDNYIFFGGATYFQDAVQALRDQCRGMAGEIETFQQVKSSRKPSSHGGSSTREDQDQDLISFS